MPKWLSSLTCRMGFHEEVSLSLWELVRGWDGTLAWCEVGILYCARCSKVLATAGEPDEVLDP